MKADRKQNVTYCIRLNPQLQDKKFRDIIESGKNTYPQHGREQQ